MLTLAAILACTTLPLHGLLLRSRPSDVGQHPDGADEPAQVGRAAAARTAGLGPVMAEGRFWGLTVAFMLASLVTVGTSVHVIPYLVGKGVAPATAGLVLGAVGLMQLPGRLVFVSIRRNLAWQWMAATVFVMQAAGIAILARANGVVESCSVRLPLRRRQWRVHPVTGLDPGRAVRSRTLRARERRAVPLQHGGTRRQAR